TLNNAAVSAVEPGGVDEGGVAVLAPEDDEHLAAARAAARVGESAHEQIVAAIAVDVANGNALAEVGAVGVADEDEAVAAIKVAAGEAKAARETVLAA